MNIEIPAVHQVSTFKIPEYKTITLDNGIPVHILQAPEPDVVRIDVVFNAGRIYERDRAIAKTTAVLLREGTKKMTSAQIAKSLDFFGASLTSDASMDTATVQIHCMGKYFEEVLTILDDVLRNPAFPDDELSKFKIRILEKLEVELSKNEVLAYRHFTEKIFGVDHPYGYNTMPEDYKAITANQLVEHHQNNYTTNKCKIFITGNIDENKIKLINETLGHLDNGPLTINKVDYEKPLKTVGISKYDTERIHQTAIRIGRRLFSRDHEDYAGMYFLNTILGGYFGSRLSSNIREDKGYTYGIYSTIDMMIRDGYFMISTDVGSQYLEDTLRETYKEINILKTVRVEEEELQLVKNYIKGNFLSLINGNLNSLNIIKTVELAGLNKSFYTDFVDEISNIDADILIALANKYLNKEDFVEIQVGDIKK